MDIRPLLGPRFRARLGRARQVNEERVEIVVEAGLYRLVHALLEFFVTQPTCSEVITKLSDGTVPLGIADSEWSLLCGLGLRRAVGGGSHPHHIPPGEVQPSRNVSSHD